MTAAENLRVPPVDHELAGPLRDILSRRPSSITPDRILTDRKRVAEARLTDAEITRDGAFTLTTEKLLDGDPSGAVSVLIARPTGATGPVPVAYAIHGGGMFAGHNRSAELSRDLDQAQELGIAVVSIDYRLAPEHPDPTPVDDCYAGLVWTIENADRFGLDPERVFVTGASAGGALAAGVALKARDTGEVSVMGQLLLCPMTDDRVDSRSSRQMDGHGIWDSTSSVTGWTALLGDRRGGPDVSPYAAPARAASLAGLPPAYVEVGAFEALRDETISYAARLSSEGVDAELHVWGGAFHSFDEWVPDATVSHTARRARADWLRRLFAAADRTDHMNDTNHVNELNDRNVSAMTDAENNNRPVLKGFWEMTDGSGSSVADSSGNGLTLTTAGEPNWVSGPEGTAGALSFSDSLSFASESGAVVTDQSFSVAAWLRLDSALTGAEPAFPKDWYAWTAVAQSGSYHSPFYLGVRNIEYGGEGTGDFHMHWNFTASPIDGSDDGPVDWIHAHSSKELTSAEADQWVFVVGVYDLEAGAARIYVPTHADRGEEKLPEGWPKWNGDLSVQLGHAWFRDEYVDQWPGSVGPVRIYSGVLTEADATSLYERGQLAGE
ncbi:alpha/beta hydrolase fold domain-containing protein [Streptomyces sp. ISL-86]|uniref:alpha/beta hydrolase fold domain-containing protein n=1 Tax=Streptomyces sp. ISL-86 TaxID=2819187 RepID=UPI001BEA43A6|nr:alpha/beta hydrolase fold domain-containing protein [Streptomyces sp. ISL-86]MBT2456058.1 alpha/beta hydrolase fold domain-containing protein [Streptomyces sp. ISL-86]